MAAPGITVSTYHWVSVIDSLTIIAVFLLLLSEDLTNFNYTAPWVS